MKSILLLVCTFGSLLIIGCSDTNVLNPQVTTEPDFVPNFSKISTEELAQAIEEEDVDDELLAEVLSVNYTTETEKDLPEINDISEEELMKYLEKEGEL